VSARIVITGGAGFIGTHLVERLCDQADVVIFDNFRRDALAYAPHLRHHPRVTLRHGDVLDPRAVGEAVAGADVVLHLASIAGVSSYYAEPLATMRVNVCGTLNLLEAVVAAQVKHFVYFSTSEVFGPTALMVTEQSMRTVGQVEDRRWVYAVSKLSSEQFCVEYAGHHGFPCSVVRPFNIYGPRQVGEGAISNFCAAVAEGKPMTVYGEGTAIRAWCYVSDLVDAIERLLERPPAGVLSLNIGNPREVETTLGLARRVQRLAPEARIEFQANERSDVRVRIPVIDRAREVLAFEPRVDLDEGLRSTLEWFRASRRKIA
jgi:nucleoside-diphosphate-sugar epimerase